MDADGKKIVMPRLPGGIGGEDDEDLTPFIIRTVH